MLTGQLLCRDERGGNENPTSTAQDMAPCRRTGAVVTPPLGDVTIPGAYAIRERWHELISSAHLTRQVNSGCDFRLGGWLVIGAGCARIGSRAVLSATLGETPHSHCVCLI